MGLDLSKINKAFKKIEKDCGANIIQKEEEYKACERIPCSSPELSKSMGGGWAFRRIYEVYGAESTGKSNLAYVMAKDFQKAGHYVVWLDFEKTFDYRYARKQGLDTRPEVFKLIQPNTIDEGFTIAEDLILAGIGLLVVDSVSASATQKENDSDYGDANIALLARSMSAGLKKLTKVIADNDASAYFVNQIRMKIVTMGNPETTSGGEALKFYASLRGRVVRTGYHEESGEPIGYTQKITWTKNKTAPPRKVAELSYYYETGLDTTGGIIDTACEEGIIKKGGGGNFTLTLLNGEEFKIRGKLNLIAYLKENEDLYKSIRIKLGLEAVEESNTLEEK